MSELFQVRSYHFIRWDAVVHNLRNLPRCHVKDRGPFRIPSYVTVPRERFGFTESDTCGIVAMENGSLSACLKIEWTSMLQTVIASRSSAISC